MVMNGSAGGRLIGARRQGCQGICPMPNDRTEEKDGVIVDFNDDAFDGDSEGNTDGDAKVGPRGIPSRNVVIDGKRTSIRLDPVSLKALAEIADREGFTVNELCTLIHERNRGSDMTFSAAIRMFMLFYFWKASTEDGHRLAGHGQGRPLAGSPFDQGAGPPPVSNRKSPRASGGSKAMPTRRSLPAADDVAPS
jgi:predicted DNA-binding ribbon-helix-helix protein